MFELKKTCFMRRACLPMCPDDLRRLGIKNTKTDVNNTVVNKCLEEEGKETSGPRDVCEFDQVGLT